MNYEDLGISNSTLARMAGNIFAGVAMQAADAEPVSYEDLIRWSVSAALDLVDELEAEIVARAAEAERDAEALADGPAD